jgi:hypothetical protein
MIKTIAQNKAIPVSSEERFSYNGAQADSVVIRHDNVQKLHLVNVNIALSGPQGTKHICAGVPLSMFAVLSDYEFGEAYDPAEADDIVVKIPVGHIQLMDGEELEVVLQNLSSGVVATVDVLVEYGFVGTSRILQYVLSSDHSGVRGDTLQVWAFDAASGDALADISSDSDPISVTCGKVAETVALQHFECMTRVNGQTEQGTGNGALLYDATDGNAGLPLNCRIDWLQTDSTTPRLLWVLEVAESSAQVSQRARRELVELDKTMKSVPQERKAALVTKGLISKGV